MLQIKDRILFFITLFDEMGNENCIADGGCPHEMYITFVNWSGSTIELDPNENCENSKCECSHYGFYAAHGKFRQGYCPSQSLNNNTQCNIRVSGREGSAVCPEGWIRFRWVDNRSHKLWITYNAAGWTDFQNKSFVSASIYGTTAMSVTVVEEGEWAYKVTVSPVVEGKRSQQGSYAGECAEDRVIGGIKLAGNVLVGAVAKGLIPKRKNEARVCFYDDTPGILSTAWQVGAHLSIHFDHVVGAVASRGGFTTAIQEMARRCPGSISKIQFWCHGGAKGRVLSGNKPLQFGLDGEPDDFEPLLGKCEGATLWFRSCSTFATTDEDKGFPGEKATRIADALIQKYGFSMVAGHTNTIRYEQSCMFVRRAGRWYGPKTAMMTQDAEIEDYFQF